MPTTRFTNLQLGLWPNWKLEMMKVTLILRARHSNKAGGTVRVAASFSQRGMIETSMRCKEKGYRRVNPRVRPGIMSIPVRMAWGNLWQGLHMIFSTITSKEVKSIIKSLKNTKVVQKMWIQSTKVPPTRFWINHLKVSLITNHLISTNKKTSEK